MKLTRLLILTSVVGLSACSHSRETTDAQLTTLLRSERTNADNPDARLDPAAIDCLRVFSGEADLMGNVSVNVSSDAGRKSCRGKLDAWLADAKRNPDKLTFEDISTPASVRRAIALYMARAAANAGAPPPAVMTGPATPRTPAPPSAPVDLGPPGTKLCAVDGICDQAQQSAAAQPANMNLRRYADYCTRRLAVLRTTLEKAVKDHDMDQVDKIIENAQRLGEIGQKAVATGSAKK
jgi:hypothetical protein